MIVRWTHEGLESLIQSTEYIRENNIERSQFVVNEICRQVSYLAHAPRIGRIGPVERTRELIIRKYPFIVVYSVLTELETVAVLAVIHTRKDKRKHVYPSIE